MTGVEATVAAVMLRRPTVLDADATVAEARELLARPHLHMLLLTDGGRLPGRLLGTLLADDLGVDPGTPGDRALDRSLLAGRTVAPDDRADDVRRRLLQTGRRRAAVVDGDGVLLGLLCLKGHGRGFCSDEGVAARRAVPGS